MKDKYDDAGILIRPTVKLESEMDELQMLRTRCGEMAAEIERLESEIDKANAQEVVATTRIKDAEGDEPNLVSFSMNDWAALASLPNGTALYAARPIPAQQSYDQALNLLAESRENFEKQFGFSADADWAYKDLAELFISDLPEQQSPSVAVPDGWKLVPIVLTDEMVEAFNIAEDSFQDGRATAPDCHWAAMISAAPLHPYVPSPRITDQDAIDKLNAKGDQDA